MRGVISRKKKWQGKIFFCTIAVKKISLRLILMVCTELELWLLWPKWTKVTTTISYFILISELYGSQESGTCQTLAWNHPLQEMKQPALRRPRGTYGLLACHQPCDDGSVNVVSSLGRIQQPIEHCCGRQEIRLWQGQLNRLVLHQLNHYH